jgi:hypothetical protein
LVGDDELLFAVALSKASGSPSALPRRRRC